MNRSPRGGQSHTRAAVPAEVSVLESFAASDVFGSFEVQLAAAIRRLVPGLGDEVVLAVALAARAPKFGHVCVELAEVAAGRGIVELPGEPWSGPPWPALGAWIRALESSAAVATPDQSATPPLRPLVWDGTSVYLQRFWEDECLVADQLLHRAHDPTEAAPDAGRVENVLDQLFGAAAAGPDAEQRRAVAHTLRPRISVVAGGPGTGKTFVVSKVLAGAFLLAEAEGRELEVALAAPTGKAAQRIREAVVALAGASDSDRSGPLFDALVAAESSTIHRLLEYRPPGAFGRNRHHPLRHDLVVVDEASMVSLPLMARLFDALGPEAQLVLVGDPYQLASIEAGTVLADVVGPFRDGSTDPDHAPLGRSITVLSRMHRFASDSSIATLADAVRTGDGDRAVEILASGDAALTWIRPNDTEGLDRLRDELVDVGASGVEAALAGDPDRALDASSRVKVLAGVRRGPGGVADWSDRIAAGVADRVPTARMHRRWFIGRPVMVTANDTRNSVFNGDVGVVVSQGNGLAVAFPGVDGVRYVPTSRLAESETWWATTIHKSQGSEYSHTVVSLPRSGSPVLTRELLYTGITRARRRLTIVGDEDTVREAVARPIARASGLTGKLWVRTRE